MHAGFLPSTRHLASPELVELTRRSYLDARTKGVPAFLAELVSRDTTFPTPTQQLATVPNLERIATSRGVSPESLRKALSGDVQWVVMKALEKDRARRYETANGFALDLRRYLDDEPVLARAPSAAYRLGKLVRRHRTVMAALARMESR